MYFLLPHALLDGIREKIRTTSPGKEQGGLLLGFRKPNAIELSNVTFPSQWDQGSPSRFYRSQRGHRIKALREWLASGRTVDWVGEWHTHPGGLSSPSSIDLDTWRKVARYHGKIMVFIIFCDHGMYVALHNGNAITRLVCARKDSFGSLFEVSR